MNKTNIKYVIVIVLIMITGRISAQLNGDLFFTLGNDTTVQVCDSICLTIKPSFSQVKKTSSYSISDLDFNLYPKPAFSGTSILTTIDDQFSPVQNLGWNFCMYDATFNQFVCGSNGILSFTLTGANSTSGWIPFAIPTANFPDYSILFPFHDINPSSTSQGYKFQIIGTAPNRKLVVSVNAPLWGASCATQPLQKQQLILHEGSNMIDIVLYNKTSCSAWQSGNATEGIQKNSTTALAVPGRNASPWTTSNEVKRFTPNGALETKVIDWYDLNGNLLASNQDSLSMCFSTFPQKVIGKITFNTCTGVYVLQDTVVINGSLYSKPALVLDSMKNNHCNLTNSGMIALNAIGAYAPYTYSLNNGPFVSSGIFTNLANGIYNINVQGNNGCKKDTTIQIISIPNITISSLTIQKPTCNTANGSVQVNASNGTTPYTYSMGSGTYASTNAFTGLVPGTYTFHVKDAFNCVHDTTINLTQDTFAKINSITVMPATCNGQANGSANIQASGVPPLTYALGSGGFTTSPLFTGLAAGTYIFHVKDGNGCLLDSSFIITEPNGMTITGLNIDSTTCFGGNDGEITITGSGGTPVYTYSIGSGGYSTSNNFTGLQAGTYTVHIKDANSCIKDTTVTVASPPQISVNSVTIVKPNCNQSNGSITVMGSSNVMPVTYALGTGSYSANNAFTGLMAGTYVVHIKDANNCIRDTSITLINNPLQTISGISLTPVTCNGNNNGSITVTATGTPSFTFALNNGAYGSSNTFTGLTAGTYTVHVKDGLGCIADSLVTIVQPNPLVANSIINNSVSCQGQQNGSISITAGGGTPPYTYAFNNGTFGSTNSFTGLSGGSYTIHIKDTNNCTSDTVISIIEPNTLTLGSINISPVSCNNSASGSVTLTGSNGTAPYTYAMNSGSFSSSNTFSALTSGTYTFHILDAHNCSYDTTFVVINPNAIVIDSLIIHDLTCAGDSSGSIKVIASGGTSTLSYALGTGSYGSSNVFSGLSAGTYIIHVKDLNNCTKDTIVIISENPPITFDSVILVQPSCNVSNGSIAVYAQGTALPLTYSINSGPFTPSSTFPNLAAGNYVIVVKDTNGCDLTSGYNLIELPLKLYSSVMMDSIYCNGDSTGTIHINSSSTANLTYSINSGTYGTNGVFNNLPAGNYTLHVKDSNNCVQDSVVTMYQPPVISMDTIQVNNISCHGLTDGSINVHAVGGTPPFTYAIGNGSFTTNHTFSGLTSGTYTIHILDAKNCTLDTSFTIIDPSVLKLDSLKIDTILCSGVASGGINVFVSGGTPGYSYALGTGLFSSNSSFSNLVSGTYSIHIKDSKNCTIDTSVTVIEPNPLTFTSAVIDSVACHGGSNGKISVAGTGGTAPYMYAIGNGTFSTASSFTGLTAGTYTIHIQDAHNCLKDSIVTVHEPSGTILDSAILVKPICNQTNGSIAIHATSDYTPLTYALGTGGFNTSNTFTGLAIGTYTIHIKDAKNCVLDTTLILKLDSIDLIDTINVNSTSCFGNQNGSISIIASGVAPLTYAINSLPFSTNNMFSNIGAGTYTVHVKDGNGCTQDSIVMVNQPSEINLSTVVINNISCHGLSDGTITVQATGGVSPYTYALGSGTYSTTNTFSSLSSGNHVLHIKDANNCIKDSVITVTEPSALQIGSFVLDSISCYGNYNGAITLTGAGGTPTYTYALGPSNFTSNNVFNGLAAGTYTVTIQDSNLCKKDTTVTIYEPGPITLDSINFSKPTCNLNNGSMTFFASGGIQPLQYAEGLGAYSSSNVFTGLGPGTYNVHIKDANNCILEAKILLEQDSVPAITNMTLNANMCFGDSLGSISLQATGVPSVLYALNNGSYSSSSTFTNLAAGTYNIHVKDGNGCIKDTSVSIVQPTKLEITSLAKTNVTCHGDTSGSISVSVTGGTAPYKYALGSGVFSSNNTFTGLAVGSYTLHIKDTNNCTRDTLVNITEPTLLVVDSFDIINVSCNGSNSGGITMHVHGGTTPYTFAVGSGAFGTSNILTGQTAGTHIVHIKDANGCQKDTSITIIQSSALDIDSIKLLPTTCYGGSDGMAVLFASGGTPTYQFAVGTGSFSTSNSFSNLSAGTYMFHVRDSFLCTRDTLITITQPVKIHINSVISPVLCHGDSTGSIVSSGSLGWTPYTFSIDGGSFQNSGTFSNLWNDTFLIAIKDSLGCQSDTNIYVPQPTGVSIQASIINVACMGDSSGSVTLTGVGGQSPYEYSFNGSAFSITNLYSGLPAGNFVASVQDSNGCVSDTTIAINQNTQIVATTQITDVSCFNGNNGTITVNTTGGQAPYKYSLNGSFPTTNNVFNGLTSGVYVISVIDSLSCFQTFTVTVNQPNLLSGNIIIQSPTCQNVADGIINVLASGGSPSYTYSINNGTFGFSNQFTSLDEGSFFIQIKDNNGCIFDTTVNIISPPVPKFVSINLDEPKCYGESNGAIIAEASGNSPFQYSIDGVFPYQFSNVLSPIGTGTYTVRAKDVSGCIIDTIVTLDQPEELEVVLNSEIENCATSAIDGKITAVVSGGIEPYKYSWIGSNSTSNVATGLDIGTYSVTVKDSNNCATTVSADVIQDNCCRPFVPTAFSPNRDNLNDEFYLANLDEAQYILFEIFNRYGQKVFQGLNGNARWDGTFNNKNCDVGVYIVKITYSCRGWNGEKLNYIGEVTLLR